MAEKESIRERSKRINPYIAEIGDNIERTLIKHGFTYSVILTEDMTPEEEEMAFYESYLKEGYPPEIAEQKAKESASLMRQIFKY